MRPKSTHSDPLSKSATRKVSTRKITTQLLCAVTLVIVGCGLLVAGFIVPPRGEIHPSVLIAFGEILTFVGSLFGIDYHYKFKYHKNKS